MTPCSHAPTASPRWPILATLVAAVLAMHLVLLAGGITLNLPSPRANSAAPTAAVADTKLEDATTAAAHPERGGPLVRVSTVRWIVPTPALEPRAEPAPRTKPAPPPASAPRAVTASAPRPAPPLETPAAALAPDEPIAISAEAVVEALLPPAVAAPVQPDSDIPLAEAAAPGDTDETLLAAAATAKPRPAGAAIKLPPAVPPASTRLLYDVTGSVKGLGYKAQGTLDWTVANGRYDARMDVRVLLLGSRSQTSTGRIGPNGLMPERFADKSRSEKAAHFDTASQRITFSNNAPEAVLQPGAQDRLSLFLQLASLMQARPQAYAAGQTVDMQVAGTGDAPIWRFEVGGESTISLPAGEFKVRRLVRQPRKEFDSTVEMWLAPSLGHLPVRLRVTQSNGDVADQQLSQMP